MPTNTQVVLGAAAGLAAGLALARVFQVSASGPGPGVALVDVAISPPSFALTAGQQTQLTAEAVYSDGSRQPVTAAAAWASSDPNIASVSGGLVTAVSQGAAVIICAFNEVVSSQGAVVTVSSGGGGNGGGLVVLSELTLEASGPGAQDTYDLIWSVLGPTGSESPDLWSTNHPGFIHTIQELGGPTGAYFTFILHGTDGDKADGSGRSRNEIKVDNNSPSILKGFQNDIVRYDWFFRIPSGYVSRSDDYIHQLHNVAAGPIIKLIVDDTVLRVSYDPDNQNINETTIAQTALSPLLGQWLRAQEIALLSDGNQGYYELNITNQLGSTVLEVVRPGLDLWTPSTFTRPKWGLYAPRAASSVESRVNLASLVMQKVAALG